ncbi:GNAT family N-acetyltransferase [Maritimibacter sp. HL-12]|uniref:GNAT family N-acetyltransferase n=1 Tax=Maritimibacter sp. HL-12 TaxID=1162418 RepID=UPI000A0F0CA5|nr:GNAT family N-acetyltransferase [Maritimibacter sp. HL-12]SMH50116.1 Predicted acetyltransferase, GNAT family [Maritimibacter sp. HL-12]
MLRAAMPGDEAAIEAFLADHADTSMFLRGNLREFGLEDRSHPHGTAYWLAQGDGGTIAVFGLTNAGFAMCQSPDAPPEIWSAFAEAVAGRMLAGITGTAAQVAQAKRAFGLHSAAFALDRPEPLYRLDLDALIIPGLPGDIRPPTEADRALLHLWFDAYEQEALGTPPDRAAALARERAGRAIATGQTRLLVVDDIPVAMTALNARLPDMVQVGGVFTPLDQRGQGHARRAVALHLAQERENGVRAAILFASGTAASRAYESIGFARVGTYALAILKSPVTIGANP